MNPTPVLAAIGDLPWLTVVVGVGAVMFVFFVFGGIWASRYTKVGPNEVLVISGRKRKMIDPDGTAREVGYRIVKGGGVFVYPVLEKVDILRLELMTIDVQTPEVYTSKGVPVKVDGVAQIKVKGDDISTRGQGDPDVAAGFLTGVSIGPHARTDVGVGQEISHDDLGRIAGRLR